jgi:hypothetical protein
MRHGLADLRRISAYVCMVALSVAMIGFIVYLCVRALEWQRAIATIRDAKDRIALENDILKNLFQMAGGALFLFGLYFTWRNLLLSQQGQITQRFNDAIEHLGSDKAEIRLGGIYALARIAHDSPRDHMPVMQIFASFIRERTLREPCEPVTAEVQAILTMIAERTLEYETPADVIDLSQAFIPRVNLFAAQLEGVRLVGANLSRAKMENARLRAANLRRAVLEAAYLRNADLRGADLMGADLSNASLRGARLAGADLAGAKLEGAVLLDTDLSEVKNANRLQIAAAITDETTIQPAYEEVILS